VDKKIVERFWAKVDQDGPVPEHCPWLGPCWEWTAFTRSGYGGFSINNRSVVAHRVAWELCVGPIPDGMLALHHCDNRGCVRPEHLFLGTALDNARDRDQKGRHVAMYGKDGAGLLDAGDVRAVREMLASGLPQREVARRAGISQGSVWAILRGETYRWVT
jgi:hypothetical protein